MEHRARDQRALLRDQAGTRPPTPSLWEMARPPASPTLKSRGYATYLSWTGVRGAPQLGCVHLGSSPLQSTFDELSGQWPPHAHFLPEMGQRPSSYHAGELADRLRPDVVVVPAPQAVPTSRVLRSSSVLAASLYSGARGWDRAIAQLAT